MEVVERGVESRRLSQLLISLIGSCALGRGGDRKQHVLSNDDCARGQ